MTVDWFRALHVLRLAIIFTIVPWVVKTIAFFVIDRE
jgi:hypothetical protein